MPYGRRLLHQLEAAAAGHDDEAGGEIGAGLGQRADQLVERIVAADVLAHEHDIAVERRPGGAVHGAIEPVHGLPLGQLGGGLEDCGRRRATVCGTGSVTRTTSAMFSTPHSPQPERPSSERRGMRAFGQRFLVDGDIDGVAVLDRHGEHAEDVARGS